MVNIWGLSSAPVQFGNQNSLQKVLWHSKLFDSYII